MASKQLGKLRQWAGEVISSREKSTVTDEFRELEHDVELRKEGLLKLHVASDAYHRALSKKKDSDALGETEKLLAIDALGIVMISHGEEFGEDSAFGTSLVKFGRAHSKVATLQEAYALTFQDTFLASIQKFEENIKDYEHQRKKLESRRLSYDAAISKLDKVTSSKREKEKDRKEAESELQTARLRYEETSEDVRARARAIQVNEIQQLRDLTTFLDTEMNFVQQYLEVLQDVKSGWCEESSLTTAEIPREYRPTHIFTRSTDDIKVESGRSKRSARSSRSNMVESSEGSSDDVDSPQTPSRKGSRRRQSGAGRKSSLRRPSRSASGASRKRSDSGATSGGTDKEKDKAEKTAKRLSVPGWASSAVSSVTGLGKKDKDQFTTLTDDEDDSDRESRDIGRSPGSSFKKQPKKKSKESLANASPKTPIRILKAPSRQEKKVVRALYDFTGSSDELAFKTGDEITVLNEVLDGWWMGELPSGKKGLFPTQYTEAVSLPLSQPPLPFRPGGAVSSLSSNDDPTTYSSGYINGYITSDLDDDHPFADHSMASGRSPPYGQFDAGSVTDSVTDGEEKRLMPPRKPSEDDDYHYYPSNPNIPQPSQLPILAVPDTSAKFATPVKKVPPPPPPRRSTGNLLAPPPPIPDRRPTTSRTHSSASTAVPTPTSSVSSLSQNVSPFDSATEVSMTDCQNF